MNPFKPMLALVLAAALLSGCAMLKPAGALLKPAANAALSAGALAKPEYAATLEQIRKALSSGDASPVDGYTFSRIYRYQGNVCEPADITWEDRYSRSESAGGATPPASPAKPSATATGDAQLRAEIAAILQAAGVAE